MSSMKQNGKFGLTMREFTQFNFKVPFEVFLQLQLQLK